MTKKGKFIIIETIEKVYEESNDSKLEETFFTKIDPELTYLAKQFKTNKIQAFFISLIFAFESQEESPTYKELADHFCCSTVKIFKFQEEILNLIRSGILLRPFWNAVVKGRICKHLYRVNSKISRAIIQNKPIPQIKENEISNIYDVLSSFSQALYNRDDDNITTEEFFETVEEIREANKHFPLLKKINSLKLDVENFYIYVHLIWNTMRGTKSFEIRRVIDIIYDKTVKVVEILQKISSGENVLIEQNLIEIVKARFVQDTQVALTDFSLNLLKECGINITINKKNEKNIIFSDKIPSRKLIFSNTEMEQLYLLKNLLKERKFKSTQKRLTEKNLPKGIVVLLYGAPGTGKTEIVKQIARETKREIIHVDLSQSKSMWFGESEKIVKQIFTDYNFYSKDCSKVPILFFNEADAIISKRIDINISSTGQTQNAIQNILLEELENFEGILIATTNLSNNLDSAFERRFLFKIKFQKPNIDVRSKIWKLKLPFLTQQNCDLLAEKFDFSSGQIDNIFRKNEIHEIIYNEKVSFSKLMGFCTDETLSNTATKVGFV